jgi:hypothetical protein
MRSSEVISLILLVGAGTVGYLIYTKKIKLPDIGLGLDEILGSGSSGSGDKDEVKSIVKGIEEETESESESESRSPSLSSKDLEKFIADPLKEGQRILNNLVPKKPSIIPIQKKEPSLDELISGALKGNPFRPYSGTAGRPYD